MACSYNVAIACLPQCECRLHLPSRQMRPIVPGPSQRDLEIHWRFIKEQSYQRARIQKKRRPRDFPPGPPSQILQKTA